MEMRKKLFSFLLAMLMCMGTLIIPAHALTKAEVEEAVNPYKAFTLDLSAYVPEDTTPIVKNGVTDSSTGITVSGNKANSKNGPGLVKYYDGNTGKEILAMQPAADPDVTGLTTIANYQGVVEIAADTLTSIFGNNAEGKSAANNGDDMTISFWTKSYFVTSSNSNVLDYSSVARIYIHYPSIYEWNVTPLKTNSAPPSGDVWHYISLSRKWTPTGDGTTGTTSHVIFVDGKPITYNSNNVSEKTSAVQTHTDNSAKKLIIGGSSATNMVDYSEIADFTIYTKAFTANEMKNVYDYIEKDKYSKLMTDADLGTSLAAEKTSIVASPDESFDVYFTHFIDEDTVEAGLVLTDADMNPIEADITASGLKATIKPESKLKYDTTYKLLITDALKSTVETIPTVTGIVNISTATGDAYNISLSDNLENLNNGDKMPTNKGWDMASFGATNKNDYMSVVKEVGKEDYLRVNTGKTNGWTEFGYTVPEEDREAFIVDFKYKVNGSSFFRGISFGSENFVFGKGSASEYDSYAKDGEGFSTLKFTFVKDVKQKQYKVTVKGIASGELKASEVEKSISIPTGAAAGKLYYGLYSLNASPDIIANAYIDIAEFKVTPIALPEATGINTDYLGEMADKLQIKFSKKMDATTTVDSSFVLKDTTTNSVVPTKATYDPDYREAEIELYEFLEAGHSYSLTFSGIKCANGLSIAADQAVTFTPDFTKAAGAITINADGTASITASGFSSTAKVNGFLMLVDNKGRTIDLTSAERIGNGTLTVDAPKGATTGYTLKCFVWEETENGYNVVSYSEAVID